LSTTKRTSHDRECARESIMKRAKVVSRAREKKIRSHVSHERSIGAVDPEFAIDQRDRVIDQRDRAIDRRDPAIDQRFEARSINQAR
jgi:hypothetical protein